MDRANYRGNSYANYERAVDLACQPCLPRGLTLDCWTQESSDRVAQVLEQPRGDIHRPTFVYRRTQLRPVSFAKKVSTSDPPTATMSASSPRTKRKVSPIRWPAPERGSEHAQKRPKLATEYGYWSARASSPNYNALTRSTSSRVTRMRSEDGDCSNADVTGSHQHVVMSQSPVSNGASSSERTATSLIAAKGLLQLFREKDDIGPLNTSSRGISCDRFFQKKDAGSVGHGVAYVPEMDEKLSRKYSALNSESAISSDRKSVV